MSKKSLLSVLAGAAVFIGSLGTIGASDAYSLPQDPDSTVAVLPAGQTMEEGEWVDSKEENAVEESAIAHKMTQAEKNENAKENDSWGGAITIIAMTIVLSALIVLSILFLCFGKVSEFVLYRRKVKTQKVVETTDNGNKKADLGITYAAIAAALAEHFSTAHDIEDTKLTIRRLRKAYSPWNSKIYNMRHLPEIHHNPASDGKSHS